MSCFVGKNTIHITLQMFVNPMAVKLESFRSREILHHFPSTFSLAVIEHLSNHFSFTVQRKNSISKTLCKLTPVLVPPSLQPTRRKEWQDPAILPFLSPSSLYVIVQDTLHLTRLLQLNCSQHHIFCQGKLPWQHYSLSYQPEWYISIFH